MPTPKQLSNHLRVQKSESQSEIIHAIRTELVRFICEEIAEKLAHDKELQNGSAGEFSPMFDFSVQQSLVFGVSVQQNQLSYYAKLLLIKINLMNRDSTADQAEFISMTRELLQIMHPCCNEFILDIESRIGQLVGREKQLVPQKRIKVKKVKPWTIIPPHIVGDFDLTELHREIGNEIERLKEMYRNQQQNEKVKHLHFLGTRLQTCPKQDDTALIANFLSGVVSLYNNYSDADRSILRNAYKKAFARTYSDTVQNNLCFTMLELLARQYVEKNRDIEKDCVKNNTGMSTIQFFHLRRSDAKRASISKTPPRISDTPPPSQIHLAPPKTDGANHFARRLS